MLRNKKNNNTLPNVFLFNQEVPPGIVRDFRDATMALEVAESAFNNVAPQDTLLIDEAIYRYNAASARLMHLKGVAGNGQQDN